MRPAPGHLDTQKYALFLDVDGTLLGIEERPDTVSAKSELIGLLERIAARFNGAMALISGRTISEIDRIFSGTRFPAAGAHGAELRHDDTLDTARVLPLPANVLERLAGFADRHDGLLLEHKQGGVSLHYRAAADMQHECRKLVLGLLPELEADFRLIEGKMVYEFAPKHHDKGAAIRRFLGSGAFKGRVPAFVGDDVTDEDGFRLVNERDGVSICVGERPDSVARYELQDVAAVQAWLRGLVGETRA